MIVQADQCRDEDLSGYDHCVIGAGPAGITLAVKLGRLGKRVILLEAGHFDEDPSLTDAYLGDASSPHPDTVEYRRQRFGGTSHLWGGRCVPLDPHDFDKREHVPHSGWPIGVDDIAPYMEEACAFCDAGQADFTVASLRSQLPMFGEVGRLAPDIVERIERYSLPTDFGRKFRRELADATNVRVVLNARAVGFLMDEVAQRITGVELHTQTRQARLCVSASEYTICGGGIESTRLLLIARGRYPSLARLDYALGKFYACHFDAIVGCFKKTGPPPRFHFERTKDGVYARRKLQFSAAFQSANRLLNSTFRLHFPPYADAAHGSGVLSMIYLVKSVLPKEHQDILNHGRGVQPAAVSSLHHLRNVIADPLSIASFGFDWLFKMKLAKRRLPYTLLPNRNGTYPLEFNSEQVPDEGNVIQLLNSTDNYGMPRVSLKWRLTELDVQSAVDSFAALEKMLNKTGCCTLALDHGKLRDDLKQALPVGGHHMGTTRMGHSAKTSVVDKNLRVHGLQNLAVCSSSVYPTNGHANPTLLLVALALRRAMA